MQKFLQHMQMTEKLSLEVNTWLIQQGGGAGSGTLFVWIRIIDTTDLKS